MRMNIDEGQADNDSRGRAVRADDPEGSLSVENKCAGLGSFTRRDGDDDALMMELAVNSAMSSNREIVVEIRIAA